MTAFAQLGCLRLHATRGVISLAAGTTDYVIAEAGQTLSLQQDNDLQDLLWHGVGVQADTDSLGAKICNIFVEDENELLKHLVVPDLTKDDRFKDNLIVREGPCARFLACAPIRTRDSSTIIGSYCAIDDTPRSGITLAEMQFLTDMAESVMDHLEGERVKHKGCRAEQMVKALGLFVEGKDSLRDWWLRTGHRSQQWQVSQALRDGKSLQSQADMAFGVQEGRDELSMSIQEEPLFGAQFQQPEMFPPLDTSKSSRYPKLNRVNTAQPDRPTVLDAVNEMIPIALSPKNIAYQAKVQETAQTSDIKSMFSRAANLLREACAVEGCIFVDASAASYGGPRTKYSINETAPGVFSNAPCAPSTSDTISSSEEKHDKTSAKSAPSSPVVQGVPILGFSTRTRSSLMTHDASLEQQGISGALVRRLLSKYPHGNIYNYQRDGSISSSDSDGTKLKKRASPRSEPPTSEEPRTEKERKWSKSKEAAAILEVIPGARSVAWFPIWDGAKGRWFAGAFIYSTLPSRILDPVEDLTYLAAFGNSIVAELSRLSALTTSQMKTDLVSSISHELRSPLHGILASVEILQECETSNVQKNMLDTIDSCGRLLLDTLNHILDFSKLRQQLGSGRRLSTERHQKATRRLQHNNTDVELVDTDTIPVLTEDVLYSIYTGRDFANRNTHRAGFLDISRIGTSNDAPTSRKQPVTVILDICWHDHWGYRIDRGAYRRILVNLLSNAMKFTQKGFVKVTIKVSHVKTVNNRSNPFLDLIVEDSGKGISREFLNTHLYTPFAQEDALAVGTGLGLGIVRDLVIEMGGSINIESEVGIGTEAKVRLPLLPSTPFTPDRWPMISKIREKGQTMKVSLVAFDAAVGLGDASSEKNQSEREAVSALKSSLNRIMTDWLGMQTVDSPVLDFESGDIHVIPEYSGEDAFRKVMDASKNSNLAKKLTTSVAIILSESSVSRDSFVTDEGLTVLQIQPPYGPLKLAQYLYQAIYRQVLEPSSSNLTASRGLKTMNMGGMQDKGRTVAVHAAKESKGSVTETPPSATIERVDPLIRPATSMVLPKSRDEGTPKPAMRVLLVEDNGINLKLLVMYMDRLKIPYETATNGLEALQTYKKSSEGFKLIFMDISMPVMDGLECTREIRKFEHESNIEAAAIVALTGAGSLDAQKEAFNSGIDLYMLKPVPLKQLRSLIERFGDSGREVFLSIQAAVSPGK